MVALTPEEEVRQWFIGVLRESAGIPVHMMMSEVSVKLGRKAFRADILVYARDLSPLMVVECKRPDIDIDQGVVDQVLRYNMALNVRYLAVTNGKRTFVCHKVSAAGIAAKSGCPANEDAVQDGDLGVSGGLSASQDAGDNAFRPADAVCRKGLGEENMQGDGAYEFIDRLPTFEEMCK